MPIAPGGWRSSPSSSFSCWPPAPWLSAAATTSRRRPASRGPPGPGEPGQRSRPDAVSGAGHHRPRRQAERAFPPGHPGRPGRQRRPDLQHHLGTAVVTRADGGRRRRPATGCVSAPVRLSPRPGPRALRRQRRLRPVVIEVAALLEDGAPMATATGGGRGARPSADDEPESQSRTPDHRRRGQRCLYRVEPVQAPPASTGSPWSSTYWPGGLHLR